MGALRMSAPAYSHKTEQKRAFVDHLRIYLGLAPLYKLSRDKQDLRAVPLPEGEGWFRERVVMEEGRVLGDTMGSGDFNSRSAGTPLRRKALRFERRA